MLNKDEKFNLNLQMSSLNNRDFSILTAEQHKEIDKIIKKFDTPSRRAECRNTLEDLIAPRDSHASVKRNVYNHETVNKLLNEEGSIEKLMPSIMEQSPNFIPLDKLHNLLVNAEDVFDKCKAFEDKLLFGVLREYGDEKNKQIILIGEKANVVTVGLNGNGSFARSSKYDNISAFCWALSDESENFLNLTPPVEHPKSPVTFDSDNFYLNEPSMKIPRIPELELELEPVQMMGGINRKHEIDGEDDFDDFDDFDDSNNFKP
jgi:hypothetical protein